MDQADLDDLVVLSTAGLLTLVAEGIASGPAGDELAAVVGAALREPEGATLN